MNRGVTLKQFPLVRSLTLGRSMTVWLAGECFDVTRTGPGEYDFTVVRAPKFDTGCRLDE